MADKLAILDRRITDALAALRYARAVVAHSATSTSRWHEDLAERKLNRLLDERARALREHATVLAGATVGFRADD